MNSRPILFVVCLLFAFAVVSVPAQTVTGTLSGTVSDSSGGIIPGVDVLAKNEEIGLLRTAVTNDAGAYSMAFLPLGSYTVTVELQGFRKVIKNGLLIELNKNTVSDFRLEPSVAGEVITVSGETPAIETTTGEVKYSIDSQRIEDTPLAGRNFISLVEQIPGFQNADWIGSSNNPTNSTGSYAAFNGQGSRSTTFQIDGVNNDDSSENQNRQNVNISTIREFQVLTNAYTAEFGRAGGAVILVQTKSGTNNFHGDAYDFIQNDIFNANGFFRNRAGRDAVTGRPLQPRQIVRRNQYGGTFGGPIWIPKLFDGRDRLFFFISGERLRNKTSGTATRFIFLPGEEARACNPGEVSKPGGPYCVDPATHPNITQDLQFMKFVQSLYKTPELQGAVPNDPEACADLIASGRPNRCVTRTVNNTFPDSDYTGRLDWRASDKDNLSFRYQYSRQIRQSGRIIFGDNFGINNNRQYNLGLTATHIFTPTQVGEFRYGFGNRSTLQDVVDGNHIPVIRFGSTLCTGTCGTIIGTSTNVPINRRQQDNQFVYNHTIAAGRHTLKAGIDQRLQLLDDETGDRARGFWTFGSLDSLASIRAQTGFTGFENFLRGFVTGYQKGFGNPVAENRFGETNLYVEDKWAVRRNLTLSLGLRYEYVRAPEEIKNRFQYGYGDDKNNFEPRFGFAWTPRPSAGWLQRVTGRPGTFVIRGGYGIYHSRLFQSIFSQNQLSIRTQPPNGFASDFSSLCRDSISDPSCGFIFTPGVASRSTAFTANGVRDLGGRLTSTLLIPNPNLEMPYVQQWNLTVERRLPADLTLHLGYSGNRGIGIPFFDNTPNSAIYPFTSPNLLVDVGGGVFKPVVFDRACTDFNDPLCVVNNANGTVNVNSSGSLRSFSALTSATATLAQKGLVVVDGVPHGYISIATLRLDERRPDPSLRVPVDLKNFGWTYYHALVVRTTKRLSHGLSFSTTYSFSKSIDTGSEQTFTGVDNNFPVGKKGGAAAALRGLSSFHAAHRFVASYSYLLPFLREQQGILGRIAGGWNVTGVTTFQSGNPFTVVAGYDVNADGLSGDRPRLSDPSLLGVSVDNGRQIPGGLATDTLSQNQLPGSAFIPAQAGTISAADRIFLPGSPNTGTIGRNTFFAHGLNYTDLTAGKEFRIREGIKLITRMEFYNVFNRVTFSVPARTVLSATPLGRISGQRNPANYVNAGRDNGSRMGQLAIRLVF
ncbi:MAG: carboxypeptidase regulatory-like domain-containing protein [Acidobacteriota bacterium]